MEDKRHCVEIHTITSDYGQYATIEVIIDGESIGIGNIGGEPEDNTYYRDYSWIDSMIRSVAITLGANVHKTLKKEEE